MTDKLTLAVNHAVRLASNSAGNTTALSRVRAGLLNPGGMGLDSKRSAAWCEYGFKENLTADDFVNLYKRGGVAHGAVNKLVGNCWKTDPWIIEGEEEDESTDETPWEKKTNAALPDAFWHAISVADARRLVCRYSALILRIADNRKFHEPVAGSSRKLEEMVPVWSGALRIEDYDESGRPTMWQYTPTRPDGTALEVVKVHPDRIIILGDYSADAIGFLEPAYNAFTSMEKVEGGSGEAFLKNAARQLSVEYDKSVDLSSIAAMYGVGMDELQEKFNEAARDINRGNDSLMITQGASVTPLVASVPDPQPTYSVNLQTAAAALDMPTKILTGMQTGERASSEDQKYFNARCQSRRVRELARDIRYVIRHLQHVKVLEQVPFFSVMWDDLTEATGADKLANAKTMAEINTAAMATGQPVFTDSEIRVAAGHEPEPAEDDRDILPDEEPKNE